MALKDARKALEWAVRESRRKREGEEEYFEHIKKTYGDRIAALFPDKPEQIEGLRKQEQGLIEALDIIEDLEEKELGK